jgi:electron transfer flavoprotein alpha subunit
MANDVLVIAEHRDAELKKTTFEVLGKATELAGELSGQVQAIVLGHGVTGFADTLAQYGAATVHVGDDPALDAYSPDGWAGLIVGLIQRTQPAVVLGPATAFGLDLLPRVAARLGAGVATDVTGLKVSAGRLVIRRPIFADQAIATVRINTDPQIATVRPNTFPVPEPNPSATAEIQTINLDDYAPMAVAKGVIAGAKGKLDVSEASIVVAGGRGLGAPEHYALLEELASVLPNAAVGATRATVDAGWRPHAEQVGQTGKTISPSLYIAIGISGAVQHVSGMKTSKCIVAINKDPDAPIFKIADYGIVGDLFDYVPKLTEEIKKLYKFVTVPTADRQPYPDR